MVVQDQRCTLQTNAAGLSQLISWSMAAMLYDVDIVITRTLPGTIYDEESDSWVSMSMGLRLAAIRAAEAPL